jgi:2-dehydro-3-deoxyphosphooctonate aldolase (KDO 8-P synthase)
MPHPSHFTLGGVVLGGGPLFLIAGPCVIESETHARRMAEAIQRIASDLRIPYIFKASYDKANRTSLHSFRGPGIAEGARILRSIAEQNRLPVLTDIHSAEEAAELSERLGPVDAMLQIPAFLCRQTSLLVAAARACATPNRAVNVKKGQFVAPWDMRHAVEKVRESGSARGPGEPASGTREPASGTGQPARVTLTERGASFGYNNLVVDMRSLPILRAMAPVVFDATHSVQTPSAISAGGSPGDSSRQAVSGGQPEFIPVLARAAVAAGVDGIFLEVHDNPAEAKSDGANALPLNRLRPVLETLLAIHAAVPQA